MPNGIHLVRSLQAVLLALVMTSPASAGEKTDYSPEFAAQVRQFLLDNPEVIFEAIENLEARRVQDETAALIAPIHATLLTAGPDMRIGSQEAGTVIVEFFDYRCAICKAMVPVIEEFVTSRSDVAIVKKHLPVLSPGSERAARYVLAADIIYGTEVSQALHDALYGTSAPMREEVFAGVSQDLGLDHQLIQAQTENDAVSKVIDNNRDIAIELGIAGTPVFIGPAKFKVGAVTVDDLLELIAIAP